MFYAEGVSVGVDALCRTAGVSKRSMYQLFDSKDELLAASLERSVPGYLAALLPTPQTPADPVAQILHVFRQLEGVVADPTFRGCPYVGVATEVKAPEHPVRVVARRFHDQLTEFFRDAAVRAGAAHPHLLSQQLTMVHDGITARAVVQGGPTPGLGIATATALLFADGILHDDAR